MVRSSICFGPQDANGFCNRWALFHSYKILFATRIGPVRGLYAADDHLKPKI